MIKLYDNSFSIPKTTLLAAVSPKTDNLTLWYELLENLTNVKTKELERQ